MSAEAENGRQRHGWRARLLSVRPSDLIVLFFLCVAAGLVLAVFNVDPALLWVNFFEAVGDVWGSFFEILGRSFNWAIQYFFLGAVLVIPIWLAWRVISALTRKR